MAQPDARPGLIKSPIFKVRGETDVVYPDPNLDPQFTDTLKNINLTETGTAKKRNGNNEFNDTQITESTVAKALTGLRQQTFKNDSTLQFETAGTKLYTDDGTTRTDVTGALTLTDNAEARYRFAFAKDQVIGTNGVDETWVNTGSGASTALAGVLHTTCEDVVFHKNLIVVLNTTESGTVYPTRIRWCDIDTYTLQIDITSWPTDNLYEVYEGGAKILGGVDAFGKLMVVKGDGIYPVEVSVIDGFIEAVADAPLRGFEPVAKSSILVRQDFMIVVAKDGLYRINRDLTFELLTEDNQEDWNALNQGRIQYAHAFLRETDHQVRVLMSSASNSSGHDRTLVYDYQKGDVWFDTNGQSFNVGQSWRVLNVEYDIYGSVDGYVYQANDSSFTQDNGSDISWEINMVPNDLGAPGVNKRVVNVITLFRQQGGEQSIELVVERDQGRSPRISGNLSLGTSLKWDSGIKWGDGSKWPGGTNDDNTFLVNRYAETVSPKWTGTEPFELQGYQVEYEHVE